jgi:hypothetical protein
VWRRVGWDRVSSNEGCVGWPGSVGLVGALAWCPLACCHDVAVAACCGCAQARVRFQKAILHVFQMREKRGQALVSNGRVGRVVGGEAHPDGGEARYRLQEQLKIVVRRFPLPTPSQTLIGKQKCGHVLGQVRQRHQRLRQWSQKLADVIACRYTMLSEHDVDDLTWSEHVRREGREGGAEGVFVDLANADQQSGGEGAAGEAEVIATPMRWRFTTAAVALAA